jgi:hypothetical protein
MPISFAFAAFHFLWDTFTAQQKKGNRMDIAQFCPQIIQGIRDFTIEMELHLTCDKTYCVTIKYKS